MELYDAINSRRSVRRYSDKPISNETINKIFQAVRMAPSWANMQCSRFVIIRDPDVKERLADFSYVEEFFEPRGYKINPAKKALLEAPMDIVLCANPKDSGFLKGQQYFLTDVGIAAQTLMLAAKAEGLGTVFVGVFDEPMIKDMLDIPDEIRVVGLMPLGYPADETVKSGPKRKSLDETVFNGKWPNQASD